MDLKDRIELLGLEIKQKQSQLNLLQGVLSLYPDTKVVIGQGCDDSEIYTSAKATMSVSDADDVEFCWHNLSLQAWPFVQLNGIRVHANTGWINLGAFPNRDPLLEENLWQFSDSVKEKIYNRMHLEGIW